MSISKPASIFNITVLVAALGYFVDIYDLLLFGIIRVPSLKDMGLAEGEVLTSFVACHLPYEVSAIELIWVHQAIDL